MLKITSVKIDGLEHGLITDTAPNITFSLNPMHRAMSWKVRLLLSAVGEGKPPTSLTTYMTAPEAIYRIYCPC